MENNSKSNKVSFFSSIAFKIFMLVLVVLAIVSVATVLVVTNLANTTRNDVKKTVSTNVDEEASEIVNNLREEYMLDQAKALRDGLNATLALWLRAASSQANADLSEALSPVDKDGTMVPSQTLQLVCGVAKTTAFKSSYCYVVEGSADLTMLYHPTEGKVGGAVSNEVIKKVCTDLAAGEKVEDAFVEYEYNGAMKCAAYAVYGESLKEYGITPGVVIMTCDQADVDTLLAELTDEVEDTVYEGTKDINNIATTLAIISSIIAAVALVVSLIVGKVVIGRPIVKVAESINKLSTLELAVDPATVRLAKSKSETGLIARGACTLSESLTSTISGIKEQSGVLFNTSEALASDATDTVNSVRQVETAVNEVAEGATSQAEETADATSNVISMGELIHDSNSEVEKLKVSSQAISEAVKEATLILEELLGINAKAVESIEMIYDRTNTTNASVEDIKAAITIISSIAEETNLLSLNASIEAARAGEQGRGFAVVASQIQKLAEQSNESAKSIEQITEKLIVDSKQAVDGMQDVKEIMNRQSGRVNDTNKAFDKVKENIKVSLEGIKELGEVTSRIETARSAVTDTVQNLSAIAEENAASSEESSASVTEVCTIMDRVTSDAIKLKEISQQIDEQLRQFII